MEQPLCLYNYLFPPGFDYCHIPWFSLKSGEVWRYNRVKFLSLLQLAGKTWQKKASSACSTFYSGHYFIADFIADSCSLSK